ncbi:excalibur calcium-binding domain-containing protein [Arthrobacter sp. RCC_34]|uniref:excalibur calcium-binding domain-containing protein n=1 Tax=Arthrobacter sp. RCC_34 TaxID=3239230 RepID=UPI0035250E3F
MALHRSGESCARSGDTYLAVEPALLCFRNKAGKALWMTAAQVRQTQADVAKAKAVAEAARKKAQEKAQEAARQKAAAAELQKAAAAAQQAAAEAQKPQAPAEQTPRRFVPEAPQNPPAPVAPAVPDPGSVYYANCAAVRAAGAAPIHIGQPGYSPKLDRDGDGVGCE